MQMDFEKLKAHPCHGNWPKRHLKYLVSFPPVPTLNSVAKGLSAAFKDFQEAAGLASKGLYICPCSKGNLTVDLKTFMIREILQFMSTN